MSSPVTIFLDESGYTGEDFLNLEQPAFALSSLKLSDDDCKRLKSEHFGDVKAAELKHTSLCKYPRQQRMVLAFIKGLAGMSQNVKFGALHKRYALVCKIVDHVVEPAMQEGGDLNVYERGANLAIANLLFYCLPAFTSQDFLSRHLVRFQRLLREKTSEAYDAFFRPLYEDYHREQNKEAKELMVFILSGHIHVGLDLLRSLNAPINNDPAVALALAMMAKWGEDLAQPIELVHDESSNMAKVKSFWDAMVAPSAPPAVVGYDIRTVKFPIGVERTLFAKSRDSAGVQLADVLAGAMAACLKWIIGGKNPEQRYESELAEVLIGPFDIRTVWPTPDFTPEDLDATSPDSNDPLDYMTDLLRRSGL